MPAASVVRALGLSMLAHNRIKQLNSCHILFVSNANLQTLARGMPVCVKIYIPTELQIAKREKLLQSLAG